MLLMLILLQTKAPAIQIAKNETLGVTLFDENGNKHYYKTKPEVVPIKS